MEVAALSVVGVWGLAIIGGIIKTSTRLGKIEARLEVFGAMLDRLVDKVL